MSLATAAPPTYEPVWLTYSPAPQNARELRREVVAALEAWDLPQLADDATVVATELFSNAVEHAGHLTGRVRVLLARRLGGLLVQVHDANPTAPRVLDPGLTATGGRGMRMVQRTASAWGHRPAGPGKTVWCWLSPKER